MSKHFKDLGVVVTMNFEKMNDAAEGVQLKTEEVFCGYLRQPIRFEILGSQATVGGTCAIADTYCKYFVEQGKPHNHDTCPQYLRMIARPIQESYRKT